MNLLCVILLVFGFAPDEHINPNLHPRLSGDGIRQSRANLQSAGDLEVQVKTKHLAGMRFARWHVIERSGYNQRGRPFWKCQCDCGTVRRVNEDNLTQGITTSCGCLRVERTVVTKTKHGHAGGVHQKSTKEYLTWSGMRRRCTCKTSQDYDRYGGRGISVCDRWLNSFQNFFDDMGFAPSPKHSIDRINNDGNYEPGNCRWATPKEQGRNTRKNRFITFNGKTQTVSAWEEDTGIKGSLIVTRIDALQWSVEKALTTSPENYKNRGSK